jgi:hypothetical protein
LASNQVNHALSQCSAVVAEDTFTVLGLKIVWYIYLLNTFVQTYVAVSGISRVLAKRGISMEVWLPNYAPLILGLIAQLALVRLLLEVAAIIISNSQTRKIS